ncbi:MAG TPA: lysylphosphatidylglycerol synthase transmembrane domain-containing protein, partial [Abditibacteriaceae bacterium]|nr:lysylphosphatidylglycerol synthase transmembrane domain-containing protein [Abditibacteriaceae bacterium]
MMCDAERPVLQAKPSALVRWLARLALGLVIVGVLAAGRGGTKTWHVLQAVPWPVLLGAVLFYWLGQVLSALKWQYLLRARGADLSLAACCRFYLVGMFWNLWMPTNIGGDAV